MGAHAEGSGAAGIGPNRQTELNLVLSAVRRL